MFFQQFCIRKAERPVALFALVLAVALQTIIICRYNHIFVNPGVHYWAVFLHHFQVSGFDPITYSVVTDWTAKYNVYRHPLLAFFIAPLYWLNAALKSLTGINCVQYVVAIVWVVVAVYAFVFFYRISCNILSMSSGPSDKSVSSGKSLRFCSFLLTAFLFSFAYVLLAVMAPDHFILSMMMLLLLLLLCQEKMSLEAGSKEQRSRSYFTIAETLFLFFVTAGVTLSNGVKVFICSLFVNGRRFFRLKYLLLAVLLPSALIWAVARLEYHYLVLPQEKIAHAKKAAEKKRKQQEAAGQDSVRAKAKAVAQSAQMSKLGKPIAKGEFMRWTDISTPRWDSTVENLFGESIQLHQDYPLGDVLRHRPVLVRYRYGAQYVVEGVIVLLFLIGIWCGRHSRLLWMALACAAFDMLLHLGLGFGLNEVYIMSAHWISVIPLAFAYLLKAVAHHHRLFVAVCSLFFVLTLYLYIYNFTIIFQTLT